jgi:D-alanyl-D-alanine carboxypeptidase/D-alanyl-D-alanine-endopeptidase (penicillin-binding protein 4)
VNRAVTTAAGGRSAFDYRRLAGQSTLEVRGSLPLGAAALNRTVTVDNPTEYFVRSLRTVLRARGIDVRGDAVDMDDIDTAGARHAVLIHDGGPHDGARVLATHVSAPLRDIGTLLMKVSQNLYAESLLKTVGATRGTGSIESARAVAREVLERWGIRPEAYVLADGSGLSRYNYVTAGTIATILRRMHEDPRHQAAFAATLPLAGRDGTIANRMKKTRAEGNARAKTGSIANVRSLSGYVRTRDGEPLVFSIIANDFVIPAATVDYATDLAVQILANFRTKNE